MKVELFYSAVAYDDITVDPAYSVSCAYIIEKGGGCLINLQACEGKKLKGYFCFRKQKLNTLIPYYSFRDN